jgi:hypothetical protein
LSDTSQFHTATPDEIAETLSFALRREGRKRGHHVDDMMAQITEGRLVRHLERGGFVVIKTPSAAAPTMAGARGTVLGTNAGCAGDSG